MRGCGRGFAPSPGKRRGEEGVEKPLPREWMVPEPGEEVGHGIPVGKHADHFPRLPPVLRVRNRVGDAKGHGHSPWVGHDVDQLRQGLRRKREMILPAQQSPHEPIRRGVKRMIDDFAGHQEIGIDAVGRLAACSSNISPRISSSRVMGSIDPPTLVGRRSRGCPG